ncbi:MAG: hypothetical protein J1F67_11045 [Muribaculaceae bacterium]|nr:hypothetical protein [Muribaculaceae bacterium]
MKIKIYNNYPNSEVTNHYLDIIRLGINKSNRFVSDFIFNYKNINKRDIILTSTPIDFIKLYLKGYKNQIYWMQGLSPEESYMRNNSKLRYRILSSIDKFILKKTKFIFLVSKEMHSFLENKYKLKIKNFYIMPCYNEKLNSEYIKLKNKYINNTFAYIGGLSKWQCFEQTLQIYKNIENKYNDTKLLVLTKQSDKALKLLQQYKISNFEIDCVKADEVSQRLANIKFGFVIRDEDPVNYVSTPTKISNYLSSGVIPIVTKSVRDFVNLFKDKNCLCVLESANDYSKLFNFIKKNIDPTKIEQDLLEIFDSYYNDNNHINSIAKIFSNLQIKLN